MGKAICLSLLLTSLFLGSALSVSIHRALQDVQEFMNSEINKLPVAQSRSDMTEDFIHGEREEKILVGKPDGLEGLREPLGNRPDKISVTILKDYKVQKPGGGYVSIQEQGGDFIGSLNPPLIQEFINEHTSPNDGNVVNLPIEPSLSEAPAYELVPAVGTGFLGQQQQQQQQLQQPFLNEGFRIPASQNLNLIEEKYRRKTMDGWIPLKGLSAIYKDTVSSKGTFSSAKNPDYSLIGSGSNLSPQVVPINTQTPQLQLFSQDEVVHNQGIKTHAHPVQVKNLVINPNAQRLGQRFPVYSGPGLTPMKVEIHAQNVILKSYQDHNSETQSPGTPNVSQIKAYGSTPQVTSALREQFRLSKVPNPLGGQLFPVGGLPLRAVAQAIRNGAFSRENDVVPEEERVMEITIPHTFKIRNPAAPGGYSTVSTQGLAALASNQDQDSITHHSINTPTKLEVPTQPWQQQQNSGYEGDQGSQIRHSPAKNADYGDSVKYTGKSPVQIVETHPAPGAEYGGQNEQAGYEGQGGYEGYGGHGGHGDSESYGGQENQQNRKKLISDLQEKLNRLVEEEMAKSNGHSIPPFHEFPSESYGSPGSGEESHGGGADYEGGSYGLSLDFDSDAYHEGKYHLAPPPVVHEEGHGDGGDEHGPLVEIADHGPSAKESLVKLGKNLFYTALDFSRKYNPITFIEKVKEFPPVRFEINESPGSKGGRPHGGKGWSHKRRSSKKTKSA